MEQTGPQVDDSVRTPAAVDQGAAVPARASCTACGAPSAGASAPGASSYVYAIGRIEPRFPRPSVEKEVAQAVGRAETVGLTDRQTLSKVLAQRENRYLVRQLCWVMSIKGLDTYILLPRDHCVRGSLREADPHEGLQDRIPHSKKADDYLYRPARQIEGSCEEL